MTMTRYVAALAVAAAAALPCGAAARSADAPPCARPASAAVSPPVTTRGSVVTRAGRSIPFVVDVGTLQVHGGGVSDAKSIWNVPKPDPSAAAATATMSYYAYRAEPAGRQARPIIFVWDGGPGTSTRSMLLNSFGPVVSTSHDEGPPSASAVRDNPESLLDVADLVFVDAPGTGFGHLDGCTTERSFFGVDVDAAVFQRFIGSFLKTYHRERSPVMLMGESYGGMRAVLVARRMAEAGTPVSSLFLISPLLSLDSWSDGSKANVGTENAAFLTLPTYAATAWAHHKVPQAGDLASRLREAERFSLDVYGPALLKGADLAPERKQAVATRLASLTGIPATTWLKQDLRIEGSRFRDLLEADEGRIVGREDTRVDGPAPTTRQGAVADDPALKARAQGPSAFDRYVRGTLGMGDRTFTPYTDEDPDNRWDMHHLTDPAAVPDTYLNVAPDLVSVLRADPHTRVAIVSGYFDLASPYFQTPYLISHLPNDVRTRVHWQAYPAGHSVYEVQEVRRTLHDQAAAIIVDKK